MSLNADDFATVVKEECDNRGYEGYELRSTEMIKGYLVLFFQRTR